MQDEWWYLVGIKAFNAVDYFSFMRVGPDERYVFLFGEGFGGESRGL